MPRMTGAQCFAEMMQGYDVSHIFFVPAFMLKAFAEMEDRPIRRVMVHGEKAAAYMADGYARASGKPGVCMAQMIGASNLAAGLRDGFMAGAPIIADHRRAHAAVAPPPRLPGGRRHHPVRRGDQVQRADRSCRAHARPHPAGVPRRHLGRARSGAPAGAEPPGADHRGGSRARSAGRARLPARAGVSSRAADGARARARSRRSPRRSGR